MPKKSSTGFGHVRSTLKKLDAELSPSFKEPRWLRGYEQIFAWVVVDDRLNAGEFRTLVYVATRIFNGWFALSAAEIARHRRAHERTVREHISTLIELGYLVARRRPGAPTEFSLGKAYSECPLPVLRFMAQQAGDLRELVQTPDPKTRGLETEDQSNGAGEDTRGLRASTAEHSGHGHPTSKGKRKKKKKRSPRAAHRPDAATAGPSPKPSADVGEPRGAELERAQCLAVDQVAGAVDAIRRDVRREKSISDEGTLTPSFDAFWAEEFDDVD